MCYEKPDGVYCGYPPSTNGGVVVVPGGGSGSGSGSGTAVSVPSTLITTRPSTSTTPSTSQTTATANSTPQVTNGAADNQKALSVLGVGLLALMVLVTV